MNKKNIKNIIRFCLYSIIALSATNLLCAEKRKRNSQNGLFLKNILNSENAEQLSSPAELIETYFTNIVDTEEKAKDLILKKPKQTRKRQKKSSKKPTSQQIYYNFADIDTKEKYKEAANKLPAKKSTTNVVIICNLCNKKTNGKNFSETYSNINLHRKNVHKIPRARQERSYSCAEDRLFYTSLPFSSVNTPEKYLEESAKIDCSMRVSITCDECDTKRTGLLAVAYKNILQHKAKKH